MHIMEILYCGSHRFLSPCMSSVEEVWNSARNCWINLHFRSVNLFGKILLSANARIRDSARNSEQEQNANLMWNRYTSSTKWSTISKIDILCTHGQFGKVFHMFWIGNDTFPLMISANTHFIEQSMNRVPSTGLIGWKKRRENHRNNNNS